MTFFSWSKWTRIKPSPSFSPSPFCNLFMSFKCPVPYASQPGKPLPYGLGLGDNIKMSSNKPIYVCCTIWPSDACVVDLSYPGPVIWFEWCKPIIQERPLCRPHLVGECGTWWRWMLGACPSSQAPLSPASISVTSACQWGGEGCYRTRHAAPWSWSSISI